MAVQVAANSPKMAHTWWRRASAISPDGPVTAAPNAPYRIRPPVVRDGLAGQYCTENGLVVYARPILAPGPHAAAATAQVVMLGGGRKRKPVADSGAGGDGSP